MKVTFFIDNDNYMGSQDNAGFTVNGKKQYLNKKLEVKHYSPTDVFKFHNYGIWEVNVFRSDGFVQQVLPYDGNPVEFSLENGYEYVIAVGTFGSPSHIDFDGWVAITINSFSAHNVSIDNRQYATITVGDTLYVPRGTKIKLDGYISGVPTNWILDPDVYNVIVTTHGQIEGDH